LDGYTALACFGFRSFAVAAPTTWNSLPLLFTFTTVTPYLVFAVD